MRNFFILASEIFYLRKFFTSGTAGMGQERKRGGIWGRGEIWNLHVPCATCWIHGVQMDGAPTSEIWRRLLDSTRGLGNPANNNDPRKDERPTFTDKCERTQFSDKKPLFVGCECGTDFYFFLMTFMGGGDK